MKVYLDNSATTQVDPMVFEAMTPYLTEIYGNPSSIHAHGREARATVERCRKTIAGFLNTSPSEIFFTSGGTEADNTAIVSTISSLSVKTVITSRLEHHAVLHTLEALSSKGLIEVYYVEVNAFGDLDYDHLERLIGQYPKSLVSLMHVNNEIGNINDISRVGTLVKESGAVFHSDTVQSIGKVAFDLQALKVDFIVGAAHKIHGPKGVGFLYVNHENKIAPFIYGGAQERNMRGGTENLAGIVGLARAMEIAHSDLEHNQKHLSKIKEMMVDLLKDKVSGVSFNGRSGEFDKSLFSVLNVGVPESDENDMLLFNLDIKGISVSGGSACASGSAIGSHVLTAIDSDPNRGAIRFSFSKYTTEEEVRYAVDSLVECV